HDLPPRCAQRENQNVPEARPGAESRGILAIEDAALGHVNFYRPHLALAPWYVPEKRIGQGQREMRDGARQCRVVIGVGLRARAGKIEMELIALLGHGTVKLLGDRLASFSIEGGALLR